MAIPAQLSDNHAYGMPTEEFLFSNNLHAGQIANV